jgi:hypothetical protein
MRRGTTGDVGCDGWVQWETVDDDLSYVPTMACGHFLICLGEGTSWGASADDRGCAIVLDISGRAENEEDEVVAEVEFSWSMAGVVGMAREVADRLEHPAPDNVVEAARELWLALLLEEVSP